VLRALAAAHEIGPRRQARESGRVWSFDTDDPLVALLPTSRNAAALRQAVEILAILAAMRTVSSGPQPRPVAYLKVKFLN
jgi:hypothetical protein